MAKQLSDPFGLFGPRLEKVVIGGLKDAINAHGSITPDKLSSASKRIVSQLQGYLKQFSSHSLQNAATTAAILDCAILREERDTLQRKAAKLGYGLSLIRDGAENPSDVAKTYLTEVKKGNLVVIANHDRT